MRYLPNSVEMKQADLHTIEGYHISAFSLMEQAAKAVVEEVLALCEGKKIIIVCGSGNNGGDGFAIGRMLLQKQKAVEIVFGGEEKKLTREARQNFEKLKDLNVEIKKQFQEDDWDVVIDCLFGVGLSREITGIYQEVISLMNQSKGIKVAVDIPTGISADTGSVLGTAFRADYTIALANQKKGMAFYPGKEYCGEIRIKDIGISQEFFDQHTHCALDLEDISSMLPMKKRDIHKGNNGKLLLIAGSEEMAGAALLAAKAALSNGIGMLYIYSPKANRDLLEAAIPEALIVTYKRFEKKRLLDLLGQCDGVVIGPGLGCSKRSEKIVRTVLKQVKTPCLIDADAINILSKHKDWIDESKAALIFTPHLKELSRLLDCDIETIKNKKQEMIKTWCKREKITLVAKDAVTLVYSKNKNPFVNTTGNQGMAKGGSGDVLAGLIGGFIAQGMANYEASILGVFLHGAAGDLAKQEIGIYSMQPSDLVTYIKRLTMNNKE